MTTKLSLLAAALTLSLGSATAFANDYGKDHPQPMTSSAQATNPRLPDFAVLDNNRDGYISVSEYETYGQPAHLARTDFDRYDADRDQRLSQDEYGQWVAVIVPTTISVADFAALDSDNDGYVNETQLTAAGVDIDFDRYDADKNDELSKAEYQVWLRDADWLKNHYAAMDSNHDGRVTRDELAAVDPGLPSRFEYFDIDGDNMLSEIEYENWFGDENFMEDFPDLDRQDNLDSTASDMHQ